MKRLALQLVRNCGGFAISRALSARLGRILMYHNFCGTGETCTGAVDKHALSRQLAYLQRHFRVVPLATIFECLENGTPLDPLTVALTIDDGRRNCYEILFPLLKEFQMPATFFVVTSFVRNEDWLWTDKVLWLSEQPSRPTELSSAHIDRLFASLNRLRPEARDAFITTIARRMSVCIPVEAPAKYAPCSWNELREMADSGLVEIGSHTVNHPVLSSLTDEESWQELTVSRAHIEEALGRPVRSFCFPNGTAADYRVSHLRQVRNAGYVGAVVASYGMVANGINACELPRLGIGGAPDILMFSKILDGAEYYQIRFRKLLGWNRIP